MTLETIAKALRLSNEVIEIARDLAGRYRVGQQKLEGIWGASLLVAWRLLKNREKWQKAAKLHVADVARASDVSYKTMKSRIREVSSLLYEEERLVFAEVQD